MLTNITPADETTASYLMRCSGRELILVQSTMNFVQYFIGLGDDKPTAESKVSQLSTEVASYLYAYVLGNKQPLIDGITNSNLPFMDAAAKQFLIDNLNS